MKYYLLITGCWLFGIMATAQNNNKMTTTLQAEETQIVAIIRQLAALMITRDTAAMNRILDSRYTLTHMTGYMQPKAEWFAEVERESMKYYSAKEVSYSVRMDGTTATCTMRNLVDARIWGSRNTWRLQQVFQLEKQNGKWMIMSSVASTF